MAVEQRVYSLEELAHLTQSELKGNPSHMISGVEDLDSACSTDASFLDNPRYENRMKISQAGAVFVNKTTTLIPDKNFLLCDNPSLTFQRVIELFVQPVASGFQNIHPTAVIHEEAVIGNDVHIGPYVVIDRGVRIGDRTRIEAGSSIGAEVAIGEDCHLYPHVTVREGCLLGNRVIIQPGAVIGSSGYGYFTDKKGRHTLLKQLGNVVLEDDVEIGANTTIDRARFKTTKVSRGTKIDNLVQIAHQVCIGEDNLIVSQTGIAGSATTGKNVVLAGQVGVVGHIHIADQVILAARSAPIKSIEKSGVYSGAPAMPVKEFNEQAVYIRNLPKLVERFVALEKKVHQLEVESAEATKK